MNIKIKIEKQVNAAFLLVHAKIRYWDDAEINGVSFEDGCTVPLKNGETWNIDIDIDLGIIIDWPKGIKAIIHFCVCDKGVYTIADDEMNTIKTISSSDVPRMLRPKKEGGDDCIVMEVDENGKIQDWIPDLSEFTRDID